VLQRSGLSAIGDILRHRRLSLFGYMLHAWIIRVGLPAHEALRLMVAGLLLRKQEANGQLEKTTDPPSQRLAQQGPEGCQRPTAIYAEEI